MSLPLIILPQVKVLPGERFATDSAFDVSTLLGSCVSACLFDPVAKVAGLNHFLLAAPRYSRSMSITTTDAGRYGINAMELLINDMIRLGAARARLRAKVFGGASVLVQARDSRFICVSEVNQRFIREYLAVERIGIASEDLGGDRGRVIHFHTDTFRAFRRFIRRQETEVVDNAESEYWRAAVENPQPDEGEPILF